MKKIITIVIIMATLLFFLASCGEKIPTRTEEALNILFDGEYKAVTLGNWLDVDVWTGRFPSFYDDPELVDKVIAVLKDFKPHIKKEIEDYDSSSEGDKWNYGGLSLYINTGSAKTDNIKMAGSNGDFEIIYNYEIYINFNNDKFHISIYDKDSGLKTSAYFKCDVDTLEYRNSLKAIFEQETNAE